MSAIVGSEGVARHLLDRERPRDWVEIRCPVCAGDASDPGYLREHETGSSLGRVCKTDVVCRDCGFMYTNPRPSRKRMAQYYAEASGASGSIYHSMDVGSRLERLTRERSRFIESAIGSGSLRSPGTILDIGCSVGDLLERLDLPGWRKRGLEPSKRASEVGRARGLSIMEGTLEATALGLASLDVVTCISVLEHVWDLRSSLEKIARSLVPGGLAIFEVPDSTRPVAQIAEFYSFEHLSHFTRTTLLRSLDDVGLEAIRFDDDVSLPNLRVCARRIDRTKTWRRPATDANAARLELLRAIGRYRDERRRLEASFRTRLERTVEVWRARGARVALYGAGMHSRFLLDLFDFAASVECVLDSDPAKAGTCFMGWPVFGPDRIETPGIDAILISTHAFEREVYDAIAPVARSRGIEVVRCYE